MFAYKSAPEFPSAPAARASIDDMSEAIDDGMSRADDNTVFFHSVAPMRHGVRFDTSAMEESKNRRDSLEKLDWCPWRITMALYPSNVFHAMTLLSSFASNGINGNIIRLMSIDELAS